MGSVADVRAELLASWRVAVERTGMVVISADSADTLAWVTAKALAAADDRADAMTLISKWRGPDFGPPGPATMRDWFEKSDPSQRRFGAAEAVSWHCRPFATLGWLDIVRLDSAAWGELDLDRKARFSRGAWTRQRVLDELPPASLVVDDRTYCFAPADPLGQWAYFDIVADAGPPRRAPDAPLRSVRLPGGGWQAGRTVLTTEGRRLAAGGLLARIRSRSADLDDGGVTDVA